MYVTANKVTKILYDKLVLEKIGFMMYYMCRLLVFRMIETLSLKYSERTTTELLSVFNLCSFFHKKDIFYPFV